MSASRRLTAVMSDGCGDSWWRVQLSVGNNAARHERLLCEQSSVRHALSCSSAAVNPPATVHFFTKIVRM